MDRDRLAQLLDTPGAAFSACRSAVLAGARFWVTDIDQPASGLFEIYRRRDAHTRQEGISTLGFTAAVETLRALGQQPVRLRAVDLDEPPYHFQLFLNADATAVVACLGVDQSVHYPVRPTD
ncbi:hypothetical protein [Asanoa sp. NPDC050611]|uniref:hypothetical protein n=1 Tax=Asanoa sp. NPDC050611 TaxID=3157098 RepID=UPI0033BFF4AE